MGLTETSPSRDDTIVLDGPKYLDITPVKNEKHGCNYEAHFWRVLFIRLDDIEYDASMPGLLRIRTKRLR
jgi:hypothetical protein